MLTVSLTDTVGSRLILSVKVTVTVYHCVYADSVFDGHSGDSFCPWKTHSVRETIGTMINFDGDLDGHGDGDATCKQTFRFQVFSLPHTHKFLE